MKIVLIKLGALGDVVRTIPLATSIKRKYPGSELIWITKENAVELLKYQPDINTVLTPSSDFSKKIDILYNFDIEETATALAQTINAEKKFGFYADEGFPVAFNLGAEYYLNTLFDDELKKSNRKTYQKMMHDAAELPYKKEKYTIFLDAQEISYGERFIKKHNLTHKTIVGINVGASKRWPSKSWDIGNIKECIKRLIDEKKEVLLLGGVEEKQKISEIYDHFFSRGIVLYRNNPTNTVREFSAMLNICNYVICSDTFALHLAVGLNKKTIGLFFCTSPYEVETYGILKKITAALYERHFPQDSDKYISELSRSISVEEVLQAIDEGDKK